MSKFVPNKEHSRRALIFCFHLKKNSAESYRMLREAYGEHAPSQDTCERWFRRFKKGDFDVTDKKHGKPPKKFLDEELEALLKQNSAQTPKQLADQLGVSRQAVANRLKEMGKVKIKHEELMNAGLNMLPNEIVVKREPTQEAPIPVKKQKKKI